MSRPQLVCLHGVTSHARHFDRLAERLDADVVALDLRGHADAPGEPPWHLEQHVADVLAQAPREACAWLGHSFGGRVAYEVAAARPERVERLVLLDPALLIPPQIALDAAERAREERSYASFDEGIDRSYASFDEAIDRRYEESALSRAPRTLLEDELRHHLVQDEDAAGRWRYRYSQSAVVAAYGEMSREPPPFERVRVPTLLVLGEESYIPYDDLLEPHREALGDLLEVVRVPGGHTVLWDALDETVEHVRAFLGPGPGI